MKVLILTITAGQGHNQTAKAISEYLTSIGVESTYMDTLEYVSPVLAETVSNGYLMSTKAMPKLYGGIYQMAEKRDMEYRSHSLTKITDTILSKKLVKYINEEFRPDIIVCTHIFSALLITQISDRLIDNPKTVGIITDFTIHPYWEDSAMDYYITASELLTNQAVKKSIAERKIKPLGIPIKPKFAKKISKDEAREILGIENKSTVLVMSGSMGYGNVVDIIKDLDKSKEDFQIVSVCGYNDKLKNKIDGLDLKKKIYNHGFVDNVDIMMDAADCIVTKPGGLTSSEALAKRVPILMVNPIPGQEDRNVEFFLNNGAAIKISSTYPIDEAMYQLMNNPKRGETLEEMIDVIRKPNSTADLAEFLKQIYQDRKNQIKH